MINFENFTKFLQEKKLSVISEKTGVSKQFIRYTITKGPTLLIQKYLDLLDYYNIKPEDYFAAQKKHELLELRRCDEYDNLAKKLTVSVAVIKYWHKNDIRQSLFKLIKYYCDEKQDSRI